ncbi:MAG: hypothetical protein H0T46_33355 [Deltaproteobacteria bacterium]|nr:hypothetical protein [Deltaproteobacteria bacterium]
MDINRAVSAIDAFVKTFESSGAKPVEVQVRPSGDDVNCIKIWVDLGSSKVDTGAWAKALEAAVKKSVSDASGFELAIRAEADAT